MSEGFPVEPNHELDPSKCSHCGERTEMYALYMTAAGDVCWECFEAYYNMKCGTCKRNCSESMLYAVQNGWGGESYHCEECLLKKEQHEA
jgi:recombinational DNA repair protein (RecF pathway)